MVYSTRRFLVCLSVCYFVLYFSVLLVLRLPRLGKRELILVLFVRLFGLCLFGFVGFLFLMVSGKGCGLWLWHSLDFSLTFFFFLRINIMRRNVRKCTFRHVRPAKIQISLYIRSVGSESLLGAFWIAKGAVSSCRQRRLWSDWAGFSLFWMHMSDGTVSHVAAHYGIVEQQHYLRLCPLTPNESPVKAWIPF